MSSSSVSSAGSPTTHVRSTKSPQAELHAKGAKRSDLAVSISRRKIRRSGHMQGPKTAVQRHCEHLSSRSRWKGLASRSTKEQIAHRMDSLCGLCVLLVTELPLFWLYKQKPPTLEAEESMDVTAIPLQA